jgi:hypothetical protein
MLGAGRDLAAGEELQYAVGVYQARDLLKYFREEVAPLN